MDEQKLAPIIILSMQQHPFYNNVPVYLVKTLEQVPSIMKMQTKYPLQIYDIHDDLVIEGSLNKEFYHPIAFAVVSQFSDPMYELIRYIVIFYNNGSSSDLPAGQY